jgi:hypothetical protein
MKSEIRSGGPGKRYVVSAAPRSAFGADTSVPEGGHAVDLVTADKDVKWTWSFEQRSAEGNTETSLRLPERSAEAGKSYLQKLNTAVFGPSVSSTALTRLNGTIGVAVPMFTDSNGGQGSAPSAASRISVYREGVKLGETTKRQSEDFWVPMAEAGYRVEIEQSNPVSDVSTKITGTWTFRSAHTESLTPLPMSVPRFLPELDENNATRRPVLTIPVKVEQQRGTPVCRSLVVEVSFDDGATWTNTLLAGSKAIVRNDPAAKFASLRATVTDAAGNSGQVTILRAYKIMI